MNGGTMSAPSFNVSFYASYDLTLDSTDYLIGTTLINYLNPFEYTAADWFGLFPSSIANGFYYVGWKFDANNKVVEISEDNNSDVDELLLISVERSSSPPSFMHIIIPVVITVGVVSFVVALGLVLRKRRVRESPLIEPPPEEFSIYDSQTEIKEQTPFSYCINCGSPITREAQKFCTRCGSGLTNDLSENLE
jgi:hypothetical protein